MSILLHQLAYKAPLIDVVGLQSAAVASTGRFW